MCFCRTKLAYGLLSGKYSKEPPVTMDSKEATIIVSLCTVYIYFFLFISKIAIQTDKNQMAVASSYVTGLVQMYIQQSAFAVSS